MTNSLQTNNMFESILFNESCISCLTIHWSFLLSVPWNYDDGGYCCGLAPSMHVSFFVLIERIKTIEVRLLIVIQFTFI